MAEKADREYPIRHKLNGRTFTKVVIDPHYEEAHGESITDVLILDLLEQIDGQDFPPQSITNEGVEYLVIEIIRDAKGYRMILCLQLRSDELIVINCFRDRRIKT